MITCKLIIQNSTKDAIVLYIILFDRNSVNSASIYLNFYDMLSIKLYENTHTFKIIIYMLHKWKLRGCLLVKERDYSFCLGGLGV